MAVERTVEFRLLEQRELEPDELPGFHIGVYDEAASAGVFSEGIAADLTGLWRNHRAKTYYRDGLATRERAVTVHALATGVHDLVVGRSSQGHECRCEWVLRDRRNEREHYSIVHREVDIIRNLPLW